MNRLRQSGFTVIELMIVVMILALVAGAGIPYISDMFAKRRLIGATEGVYAYLLYARGETLNRGVNIYAAFQTGTAWCMGLDDTATCDCSTSGDCQVNGLDKVLDGGDFKGTSLTTNLGGDDTAFLTPRATTLENGTITLTADGKTTSIVISNLGRVRICSDDLTDYPGC